MSKSSGFSLRDGNKVIGDITLEAVHIVLYDCRINLTAALSLPPRLRIDYAVKICRDALGWYARYGTVNQQRTASMADTSPERIRSSCITAMALWDELL